VFPHRFFAVRFFPNRYFPQNGFSGGGAYIDEGQLSMGVIRSDVGLVMDTSMGVF